MGNNFTPNIFLSFCLLIVLLWQPATIVAEDSVKAPLSQQYQEKLYVQTDKKDYTTKDSIWFRAYLVNAQTHIQDTTNHYVYAELINFSKKVVRRVKVRLENGAYSGHISFPEELATGSYMLRFYTRYMENFGEEYFFKKIINVANTQYMSNTQIVSQPDSNSDYIVSFHPEGGDIPAGVYTKVAFKSINTSGLGENIRGVIVNQQGDTINRFESIHRGLGSFIYTAKEDEQCFAICRNNKGIEKTFELPKAKKDAIALQIFRQNGNIIVNISRPEKKNLPKSLFLNFQCRGNVIYSKTLNADSEIALIPEENLPTGVIQIVLTDSNQNPISERLIFNTNIEEKINTKFQTNKSTYTKRENVKSTVEITDNKNKPLKANISISVIDNDGTQHDASTNILSTLLLTSDLKGYIENPAYYFINENEKTKERLDLVMLTHGWTRYVVSKVIREEDIKTRKDFEISQEITGTLKGGFFNRAISNDPVNLLASEYGFFDRISTDKAGKFRFNNFEFPEGTEYLIQGKDGTEIFWDGEVFPTVNESIILEKADDLLRFESDLKKENSTYVSDNNIRTIELGSVTVTAKKTKPKDRYHAFTSPFTKKIGSEEIERLRAIDMYQLLATTIRVSLSRLRESPILILVDNMEISAPGLIDFPPLIVESIEYLNPNRGGETTIYGFRGFFGVILITTKQGGAVSTNSLNTKVVTPLGYQITKEFYSPAYTTKEQITDRIPDSRTTIYWNSNVKIGDNGKADINFYTSDNPGNYSVIIEGITDEGKIVYSINPLK